MARISKKQTEAMFRFATWAHDHKRYDFLYMMKYRTATPDLEKYADEEKAKHPASPFSLHTSRGQKLFYETGRMVVRWKKTIPYLAFTLRDQLREAARQERNTESREAAEALAEVILVRCAEERTPNVILAFGSIIEGIRVITGTSPSKMSIRPLLTRLAERSGLLDIQWGEENNRRRPTHIKVQLPPKDRDSERDAGTHQGLVDDWLTERGDIMFNLHRREELARSTVLADLKATEAQDREIQDLVSSWILGDVDQLSSPANVQNQDLFSFEVENNNMREGRVKRGAMACTTTDCSDQQELEKESEKCTAPEPASSPAPDTGRELTVEEAVADTTAYFWELDRAFARDHRPAERAGALARDQQAAFERILYGLDLTL